MRIRTLLISGLFALGAAACGSDDVGYYHVSWTLVRAGNSVTCESVGADTVETLVTHQPSGQGYSDLFDCNAYQGTTSELPVGDYTIQVNLLAGSTALGQSAPFSSYPILDSQQTVNLPQIIFSFQ